MTRRTTGLIQLALIACIGLSLPAYSAKEISASKRLYRYYDDKGSPMVSDQVTDEHIRRGYDIVDRNLRLIRHLPPFDEVTYNKEKAKRDALLVQQQEDVKILRLYNSTRDAEIARDRQLNSLETSISYNSVQLLRLKSLRADLVTDAASAERKVQVPAVKTKTQITDYDQQIIKLQGLINDQRLEQAQVRSEFAPIIKRLSEIEGQKGQKTTPSANSNQNNSSFRDVSPP